MNRIFRNFHPTTRGFLFVAICALIVIPLELLAYIHIVDLASEKVLVDKQTVASATAIGIGEKLNSIRDLGVTLSIDPGLQQAIRVGDWQSARTVLQQFSLQVKDPFIGGVFISDALGTEQVAVPELTGKLGQNLSSQDWYQSVTQTKKSYLSQVYKQTTDPQLTVATLAIPLFDNNLKLRAVLAIQLNLAAFLNWTNNIDVGQQGFVYIVDQKGNLVIHPRFPLSGPIINFATVPAVQKVMTGEQGAINNFYNPIEKAVLLAGFEPVTNYGWGVIVQQSVDTALADQNTIASIYRNIIIFLNLSLFMALFWIGLHLEKV